MNYYLITNEDGEIYGHGVTPDETYPENSISCTLEQKENWQDYKIVNGILILKSVEELSAQTANKVPQDLINQAKSLLNATDKLYSGVYQRHMTESQLTEFNEWQDALYDVAYNGGTVLPDTPEFINNMGVL